MLQRCEFNLDDGINLSFSKQLNEVSWKTSCLCFNTPLEHLLSQDHIIFPFPVYARMLQSIGIYSLKIELKTKVLSQWFLFVLLRSSRNYPFRRSQNKSPQSTLNYSEKISPHSRKGWLWLLGCNES